MCIIVVKPAHVAMPDSETLRECFLANPDGAGFMYPDGKNVHLRKGFMCFEDFLEALNRELPEDARMNVPLIMHFRIATHGVVTQACCHPFPLSSDSDVLASLNCDCRIGIAHNGMIPGRATSQTRSDTMDYIAQVVVPLYRISPHFMFDDDALDILENTCNSKLALMDASGEIVTLGHFIEDNGILYSNTSYLKTHNRFSSYRSIWDYSPFYEDYYDDDPLSEDITELFDLLPYEQCKNCSHNIECISYHPACETTKEAIYASALQSD